MQIGKTKGQCLYIKPSTAVHSGALDAGTLPQYNTIQHKGRRMESSLYLFVCVRERERERQMPTTKERTGAK